MTAIDLDDTSASIELALSVAGYFMIDDDHARATAKDIARVVSEWRTMAAKLGLSPSETDRMATAFEHDDVHVALRL